MIKRYVSEIFSEEPEKWGLRGDPDFWRYLNNIYREVELPYTAENLKKDIYCEFKRLTGKNIMEADMAFAEEFAKTHKGMSTGIISSEFWIGTAIPMLSERLNKANESIK